MFGFFKKQKEPDTLDKMFPASLRSEVESVSKLLPKGIHSPHVAKDSLLVGSEAIQVYSRIYNPEPSEAVIDGFNEEQRLILSCIYTRHHDGFIREKNLKNILKNQKAWTVPFVIMLLGEYVIEIIELTKDSIQENQPLYKKFTIENPAFWEKTKSRITSYWNEYYRKSFTNKEQYPAIQIIKVIEQ